MASHEQSQGIEHVNQSVCDMEKVVQGAAATAQQSARTSEQLHEQAEQMKGIVQKLVSVVSGGHGAGVSPM